MSKSARIVMALAAVGFMAASTWAQTPPPPKTPQPPPVAPLLQPFPVPDASRLQVEVERAMHEFERARLMLSDLPAMEIEAQALKAASDAMQGVKSGTGKGVGSGMGEGRGVQEADLYESGYSALSEGRWERAIDRFNRVIEMKGERADRALYWKGYAQNKLGQSADALATLADLQRGYPKSRYLGDAKALEAEIRQRAGQPPSPESQQDEELKLLALRALQNTDPEQAIPMLEKFLKGTGSPQLKERALFVLVQSDSPRARQVLASVAKGEQNPDLQVKAVQYLGYQRSPENMALLTEIYRSTTELDVKRRILRSFMTLGEKDRLLEVARTESSPQLRAEAVRQLGVMKAGDALWDLYQKESDIEVKGQILRALFVGGETGRLIDLAKTEQNPELRRTAVRNLGMLSGEKTGEAIVAIYGGDVDVDTRKAAIEALYIQHNDVALVALARREKDPDLKRAIVERLSTMKSKVALDYLMEILNK